MHPLLEQSQNLKSEADQILSESGLIELLKGYGDVKIAGSYTLDVMLRPDIDLFVVAVKHDWDTFFEIYTRVMKSKYFRELDFVNWIDFSNADKTNMQGYYMQPWRPVEKNLWKLDVWFITPDQDRSTELTEHFKELLDKEADDSKRILILEIKQAMRQGNKYSKGVDGKLIYKAVLEEEISSVDEFKKKYTS